MAKEDKRGQGNKSSQNKSSKKKRNNNQKRKSSSAPKDVPIADNNKGYDQITGNDIEWWNKSPMYHDATRVPFNRIYGDPIRGLGVSYADRQEPSNPSSLERQIEGQRIPYATPGIMSINFRPTIGTTHGGANAPVNRAFTSLYGHIYSRTTGAMQFQQADLALFMTSLSSISMLIAVAKRALGVSQLYSGLNYYYPKYLLEALGFIPESIIGHQDELRMRLNNQILSFNNLKVPDFMSIYKRWYSLCHNIYADEDDVQSQLFVFNPMNVYLYKDVDEDDGSAGYLKSVETNLAEGYLNFGEFLELIDTLLEAWRNSSDLGLISGSIQRSFSDNALITIDYVNEGDTVIPVPDRNITWQINNATTLVLDPMSLDVRQSPEANALLFEPTIRPGGGEAPHAGSQWMHFQQEHILNSYDGTVDDEFIMEATRLMAIPGDPQYESSATPILYINTEVVDHFAIFTAYWDYQINRPGTYKIPVVSTTWLTTDDFQYVDTQLTFLNAVAMFSKFKNGPRVNFILDSERESDGRFMYFNITESIGDVYKFTTIDRQALVGLNETALQSVYHTEFD